MNDTRRCDVFKKFSNLSDLSANVVVLKSTENSGCYFVDSERSHYIQDRFLHISSCYLSFLKGGMDLDNVSDNSPLACLTVKCLLMLVEVETVQFSCQFRISSMEHQSCTFKFVWLELGI